MHSISVWKMAPSPNYYINTDKTFPYSEVPYIGEYKLVRIPHSLNQLIEHVDYWGEGRINAEEGVSGFTNCYNINHHYQLVSNGPDIDKKIPNRIPVISYTRCDTSPYIKDNSVKLVTVMGSPINNSCAKDIARMINRDFGTVVIYGFSDQSQDVKNLDSELKETGLIYYSEYNLPHALQGLTLFDNHRAYLNNTDVSDELYKNITNGNYDNAVTMSKSLENSFNGYVIANIVARLLNDKINNLMMYAYKLRDGGFKDIITNYFPSVFNLIFNEEYVIIKNKKDDLALKLDATVDNYNDRQAWGDSNDKSSTRVIWTFFPIWKDDKVYFKIKNNEYDMFLKLDVTADGYGDRKAWGSSYSNEIRFEWALEPVKIGDELLFYIINREYGQGLKLDAHVDSIGDRLLWGNNGSVYGKPDYFGWIILPWKIL